MNTMDRHESLVTARGLTDSRDRLINADDALADLHERCGGTIPGVLAVPELLGLVQQARRMGLRIAREFTAHDGEGVVSAFARIRPLNEESGGGCEVLVENWQRSLPPPPSSRDFAERLDAIDRATAELTARLDANQHVQVLNVMATDLSELRHAAGPSPSGLWSDLVELRGLVHQQPLHWRLLDGAQCRVPGSQRHWRVRLIPLGPNAHAPAGFELLLIADEPIGPLAAEPVARAENEEGAEKPASRLIGSALTPVLRQPISRIIANAETIRARLAGPLRSEYSDYAATIASAGQHLSAMLDDLADLEVVEAPGFSTAREPVDLFDAGRRAAGILGVRAQARAITLSVLGEPGGAVACAEFRRVLQVLINLIGNAIAYSPQGSTVSVAANAPADGRVSISVSDEGAGVTPEQALRIFNKFERLGRDSDGGKDQGSGLGLYISNCLAEAMQGSLTVESAEGGGARFVLDLPKV